MITIIDYKVGNLGSIANMFKKVGVKALISSKPEDIDSADLLVLPGVGRFDFAMKALRNSGLISIIEEKVMNSKTPLLGICVGLQLMCRHSEEGDAEGLGWFDAKVKKFQLESHPELRVPHMGWNVIKVRRPNPLFDHGIDEQGSLQMGALLESPQRYYFAHSYFVEAAKSDEVLASTEYGQSFHSALLRQNIIGVQFHPEKSHRFGLEMFRKFSELKRSE